MLRGQRAQLYINSSQDYLKLAEQIGKVRGEGSEQNDQLTTNFSNFANDLLQKQQQQQRLLLLLPLPTTTTTTATTATTTAPPRPPLLLRKQTILNRLNPNTASQIFDTMIFPTLSYNGKVWGMYTKQDFKKWDSSPIEKN